MPKQKTHKGTKKRFRITANGKVKFRHSGTSHLNSRLTKKRRRNLRGTGVLVTLEAKRVTKSLCGNSYEEFERKAERGKPMGCRNSRLRTTNQNGLEITLPALSGKGLDSDMLRR